jgi:hypothetical protein
MGADIQVCEYLAKLLIPGVQLQSVTLDNKPKLLADGARAAKRLRRDGCDRVVIVWDLRPAWPSKAGKPCRAAERQALLDALAGEGIAGEPVFLVCIEQEFESWIIADEVKLSAFLSTATHRYRVARVRRPDQVKNPKSLVMAHFHSAKGMKYEDRVHAIGIVRSDPPPDWSRLRRSESFRRFEAKLMGLQ